MIRDNRRNFFRKTFIFSASALLSPSIAKAASNVAGFVNPQPLSAQATVVSTWNFGMKANELAWTVLKKNGRALDAVEQGIKLIEADADNQSVGIGGLPDRDGIVTLDASIMNEHNQAGSVTFLKNIKHAISVARLVMEKTPHVMLSGEGALQFALENGFKQEDLLTEASRKAWEEWKVKSNYKPVINIENHDTIGMLAIDAGGNLSGGCSTSGLAYKMHGRVGDSPIIGAGLFIDNEVGGAVSTGLGEMVMKTLGSFLVVEYMRNGLSPQEACEEVITRIIKMFPNTDDYQVAFVAISKNGEVGACAVHQGFNYALMNDKGNNLINSMYLKK